MSFVKDMRKKAEAYDVDLLVVDTGVGYTDIVCALYCLRRLTKR